MRSILILLLSICFMLSGAQLWLPYGSFSLPPNANTSYIIKPSNFLMPQRNPTGFSNLNCHTFDDAGSAFVLRITMGVFVDYLRLTDLNQFFAENPGFDSSSPSTLCTLLTTTADQAPENLFEWTNTFDNPFLSHIPSLTAGGFNVGYMGGSGLGWLKNVLLPSAPQYLTFEPPEPRQSISIWGSNTNTQWRGGCCYSDFASTVASFYQSFTMDLALFPTLAAPTVAIKNPTTISVSWSRKYDATYNAVTNYLLEQSINGGGWTTVATLPAAVGTPFDVVVIPTSAYRFRVTTINSLNGRTFMGAPSDASASVQISGGPPPTSSSGTNGGGGHSSTGTHGGGGTGGGGQPNPPTGPVIVVVNPSNYDTTPAVVSPYVDVLLIEQLLDGTQGRDAIWYTYTSLDKVPIDPNCQSYPPIGTRALGGQATIPITSGIVLKAVACSKDGQPAPPSASGFTGPWNRKVTPVLTAIIPVQADVPLTHPSYMGSIDDATVAAVVIGNTTTVSFYSSTLNAGFSYSGDFSVIPQCPPYTAPQPSTMVLSASQVFTVVTCAVGAIPSPPLFLNVLLFVAEPVVQAFSPVDAQGTRVVISGATFGANYVYTTDGSTPKCDGSRGTSYDSTSNGVFIDTSASDSNGNITVVGCRAGLQDSDPVHYRLSVGPDFAVADPVVTESAGGNPTGGDVRVTLSSATPGATLWYTLDGVTVPSCKSAAVGQASPVSFVLYRNATVQVVACLLGGSPPVAYSSHVVSQFVSPTDRVTGDADGDGVLDVLDDCPNSLQVQQPLSIGSCVAGIPNRLLAPYPSKATRRLENRFNFHLRYGCTMRDVIDLCQNVALFSANLGQAYQDYLECVEAHARIWGRTQALISEKNVDNIMSCAAQTSFAS